MLGALSLDRVGVAQMISNEEVEPKQLIADHNLEGAANEEFQENQEVSTRVEVAQKISNEEVEPKQLIADHNLEGAANEEFQENQDVSNVKSTNIEPHSPVMSGKALQSDTDEDHHDEDDNCSLASSTAASVKFKVTVPVAPRFVCGERVARRKEFYMELEEKHKALEAERLAYEARVKEEEEAAIKQMRRSMTYKANPVPKFYREGPPPKAKLKKLPLTRPKSPNLTRRKSCSDVVKSDQDENKSGGREARRRSIGVKKASNATSRTPENKGWCSSVRHD